jgi:IS4 transposase
MPHQNTIIHALLKVIPRGRFDRLVDEHRGDYQDRKLSFWSQFTALIYGQLSGTQTLRELVKALSSHDAILYHLGVDAVCRSTLSDANRDRPAEAFAAVFDYLLPRATDTVRRETADLVRLIDSTSIRLNRTLSEWARFRETTAGAKMHLVFDPAAVCPTYFSITPMRENDITAAKRLSLEPGATYVFDLGYYDYGWWAALDRLGCRFVSRLKTNTPLTLVKELRLPEGSPILSDRIGHLPARQAKNRQNPFGDPVREVCVLTEKGEVLRLVSNDLDASADEIANLYKTRWQIELFFKWVKQNLRIKKPLGTSENAVRIQIIVALIAFLLIRITHRLTNPKISLQDLARLLRANLLHRKSLANLLFPKPRERPDHPQMCIDFSCA